MAPSAVGLTDGSVGRALEGHALLAPEGDDGVQGRARPLEPTVGQDAGRSAVDFWKEKKQLDSSRNERRSWRNRPLSQRMGSNPSLLLGS